MSLCWTSGLSLLVDQRCVVATPGPVHFVIVGKLENHLFKIATLVHSVLNGLRNPIQNQLKISINGSAKVFESYVHLQGHWSCRSVVEQKRLLWCLF